MCSSLDKPIDIFKRLTQNNEQNNEQYKKIIEILQAYSNENVVTILYDYETYEHNIIEYNIMLNILNRRDLKLNEIAYFAALRAINDNIKDKKYHNIDTLKLITYYNEILVDLKKHKISGDNSMIITDDFIL
jgi:hypothetical protein